MNEHSEVSGSTWHVFACEGDGAKSEVVNRDDVPRLIAQGTRFWINILAPTEDDAQWLGETFGFHELALTDVLNNDVRPKEELFDDVLFTVLNAVNLNKGEDLLDTINLNIFLTNQYIVSTHGKPLKTTRGAINAMKRPNDPLSRGTDFVYYFLLDGIVNRYLDVMDEVDANLHALEGEVFGTPSREIQEKIFNEKRRLAYLRRSISPKRDAVRDLVHNEFPQIRPEIRTHLRDVLDHILRIADAIESYRELTSGLMDSYMSNLSNRMNEVMKLMSIIATIMLPLSFLTGLFGMNFEVLPGIQFEYGFWALMAAMGGMVVTLVWIFRRKGIM